MATYITDAQLKTSVAASMGTTETQLDAMGGTHIAVLITEANNQAYDALLAVLIGRGYSKTVIDAWDSRVNWSIRLAKCHFFRLASVNKALAGAIESEKGICKCEQDLLTISVTNGYVDVGYDSFGAASGVTTNTDDDTALLASVRDESLGQ